MTYIVRLVFQEEESCTVAITASSTADLKRQISKINPLRFEVLRRYL